MRKLLSLSLLVCMGFTSVFAQDSAKTSSFKLTGSADVYYRYNFYNNKTAPYNNFTSFTNSQNSFELGMASLKAEHSIGKVSMVADLGFGKRAEEFSYNDSKSMLAIKQLYISYAISSKVKLTAGSWGTHVGYELVDAYANRNYSMGYMFSYGPFFHTGLKAEITTSKKSVLMVGIANPTDLKTASGLKKFAIAQFATATTDDKLKLYLNYQGGKPVDTGRLSQFDLVATYALSSKLSLGYNGTVQTRQTQVDAKWSDSKSWWGSALYVNYDPASWFGLTLREEYFDDKKAVLGFNSNIFASTLSANFRIDNLTIIPELRLDNSNNTLFANKDGELKKNNGGTFLLAAVYKF